MIDSLVAPPFSSTNLFPEKDPFIQDIYQSVLETIQQAKTIPGLSSEQFDRIELDLPVYLKELCDKGCIEKIKAKDSEFRPIFVSLQAIFEHVLANKLNKTVQDLIGVIHTPAPPTPLCTEAKATAELVSPSGFEDELRKFTVEARAIILRNYMKLGGELYACYPQNGVNLRSPPQMKIYGYEMENYPVHLKDCPLNCETFDEALVGAFYTFKNREGKLFSFAIKMTQANAMRDEGDFGLWFGELNAKSPVYQRILDVNENVLKHSSKRIPLPIF